MNVSSIDVVLCTWNSNRPFFPSCLAAIKQNVPVHHLIAIDRNSSDGTVATIRQVFPNAIITHSAENLGIARKRGVELADTPWLAFIDDDVEIPEGWFSRLTSRIDERIGAIHELDYMVGLPPEVEKWDGWVTHLLGIRSPIPRGEFVDVTVANQNLVRGLTHNTLIMTDLLNDWSPPQLTSSFEDWLIMKHVVGKGYAWRMMMDRTIKHHFFGGARHWCRKVTWNIVGEKLAGFSPPSLGWYLARTLRQTPKALAASLMFNDPRILLYVIQLQASCIDCQLRWRKYLLPHR